MLPYSCILNTLGERSKICFRPPADCQGNEVYGGGEKSAGIFLHRSGDDAIVKGEPILTAWDGTPRTALQMHS